MSNDERGAGAMLVRVAVGALTLLVAVAVVQSLPDIARYMKIRNM